VRRADCVAFLKRVLPRFGLCWAGYRKVHRTVCKRLSRRLRELRLLELEAYERRIDTDPAERARLDAMLRIPVSRFWRDRELWEWLAETALPELARDARASGSGTLRAWSCGCAAGEEPWGLALLWHLRLAARFPDPALEILATDADPAMLERARAALYAPSSLRELPADLRERGFVEKDGLLRLRPEIRAAVSFLRQDLRREMPDGPFDLLFCRNLVFTYFARDLRCKMAGRFRERLRPGGLLILGAKERLPERVEGYAPAAAGLAVHRRLSRGPGGFPRARPRPPFSRAGRSGSGDRSSSCGRRSGGSRGGCRSAGNAPLSRAFS